MEAGTIFHSIQMLETRLVDLPSWSLCILDSTILVNQLPMERNPLYCKTSLLGHAFCTDD